MLVHAWSNDTDFSLTYGTPYARGRNILWIGLTSSVYISIHHYVQANTAFWVPKVMIIDNYVCLFVKLQKTCHGGFDINVRQDDCGI